jgi:hypothetical protein
LGTIDDWATVLVRVSRVRDLAVAKRIREKKIDDWETVLVRVTDGGLLG